jgi:two-component system cell cycle response regulator DivK
MPRSALLIDDDEPSLKLQRVVLEAEGWVVIAVRTPNEAAELLRTMRADVIVTDLFPPNPIDTIRDLRRAAADTPIVAVTARNGPETEFQALAAGCSRFLRKPIDVGTFAAQLEPYCGGSQ